jgi:hypothetical protein
MMFIQKIKGLGQIKYWDKIIILYAIIISIARTIRQPNDWSEAHWLVGYQLGVYKRGLIGSIVNELFNYEQASTVEKFIFFCSILLVVIFVFLLFKIYQKISFPLAIAMATSPLLMMFGHLVAYFDYFLFIITFLSLYCIKTKKKIFIPFLLILGLLIHESIAFIGFPVIVLALLSENLSNQKGIESQEFKKKIYETIKIFVAPVILLLLLVFFIESGADVPIKKQAILDHLNKYGFIAIWHELVADAYNESFIYYLKTQYQDFPNRFFKPIFIPIYLNIAFFLAYFHIALRKQATKSIVIILVYFVILSPLLLHLIAWDTTRIWVYPLLQATLLFYVFSDACQMRFNGAKKHLAFFLCLFMAIMNIIYEIPLVDDIPERFSLTKRLALNTPILFYLVIRYILSLRKPVNI